MPDNDTDADTGDSSDAVDAGAPAPKRTARGRARRNGPNSAAAAEASEEIGARDSAREDRLGEIAMNGDDDPKSMPSTLPELQKAFGEQRRQLAALKLANVDLAGAAREKAALENKLSRFERVIQRGREDAVCRWRPVTGSSTGDRCMVIFPRTRIDSLKTVTGCVFDVLPSAIGEWIDDEETGAREFVISDPGPSAYESQGSVTEAGDFYTLTR